MVLVSRQSSEMRLIQQTGHTDNGKGHGSKGARLGSGSTQVDLDLPQPCLLNAVPARRQFQ